MTNEEAIKLLQKLICCESHDQHFCTDACQRGTEFCAIALAIEALDKQIPKRGDDTAKRSRIDVYCPRCKQYVGLLSTIDTRSACGCATYCTYCGQRIAGSIDVEIY